jgi:hypothetical protein
MTESAIAFEVSIKDAEELLSRFDAENGSPSEYNSEALKRAGLVMAMAAWETYVKDRFTMGSNLPLAFIEILAS